MNQNQTCCDGGNINGPYGLTNLVRIFPAHPLNEAGGAIQVHRRLTTDQHAQEASKPTKWSIWACDTKTCAIRRTLRAGNAARSPRSNWTARFSNIGPTKSPESPNRPLIRIGWKRGRMDLMGHGHQPTASALVRTMPSVAKLRRASSSEPSTSIARQASSTTTTSNFSRFASSAE